MLTQAHPPAPTPACWSAPPRVATSRPGARSSTASPSSSGRSRATTASCADDAAEVSQTTWLRLAEHIDRLQDPSKVGGWLATTARHESLRVLRGAGRQIPMGDDMPEPASPAAAIDEELLRSERDSMLWQAFSRLPARDRSLLRLLISDPMPSYEEIGAALGMPVGSIGPTRARCLERLRREAELLELAPN